MHTILIRYITKSFFKSFLAVFFCFYVIVTILDMMDVVRQYYSAGYNPSIPFIIKVTLCRALLNMTSFFSFIVLLSAIVFFIVMNSRLEITIIKSIGTSTKKLLQYMFISVAILSVLYITVFDAMSVYSFRYLKLANISMKYDSQSSENLTITNKGIWFRDKYEDVSYIISARGFNKSGTSLFNVRIFTFDKYGDLNKTVIAKSVNISNGQWKAADSKEITNDGETYTHEEYQLPTHLSYKRLQRMVTNPQSISFWQIRKYMAILDKVGLSSVQYQMHWFSRISVILQMFAFVAMVTAFCINYNPRDNKTYIRKIACLLIGAFPIHFINNVILAYGTSGKIPISLAATILPAFVLCIGLVGMED